MTTPSADAASIANAGLNSFVEPQDRDGTPWLLAVLCLIIPLLPSYVVPFGNRILSPALIISGVLLGLVILGFVVDRRAARITTMKPGVIIILLYFMLASVAYIGEASRTDYATAEPNRNLPFTILLATLGIALFTMTRIATTRQRSIVLGVLAVGLTYLCTVGVLQNYVNIDLRLLFQPPGFLEARQMSQAVNVATLERFDAKRSFGTSDHASEFSVLAAVAVPLTIHFVRYAAKTLTRLLAAVGTGVALIGVLAGVSRSGVVALAGALLVYIWALKLRTLAVGAIGSAALIVGMAAVVGPAAVTRSAQALWTAITEGASLDDPSVVARVERYAAISQVFQDHPFFGLGVGRFPPNISVLDNQWLKALVEGGLTSVTAMIVLAAGGLVGIAAALRAATTPRERDQAYAMGAIFTGILATSFTLDLFLFAQATLVLFLVFGLLWSTFTVPIPES
jgi:O-antigen ligase